jgi:hypothetical protein
MAQRSLGWFTELDKRRTTVIDHWGKNKKKIKRGKRKKEIEKGMRVDQGRSAEFQWWPTDARARA